MVELDIAYMCTKIWQL